LLIIAGVALALPVRAEVVDRVIASIGNDAITQSDAEDEYRLERFLEGESPEALPATAELKAARDRLIDQRLLLLEAETEGGELPDLPEQAGKLLDQTRKRFPDELAYQRALQSLGMDEQTLLRRLALQVVTLRLIDQRLRPAAWVEQKEIETYYQNVFVPQHERRAAGPPPPLEDVAAQIREILVQQKIDALLTAWLNELRSSHQVKIHTF
jgi:parvulin-like peptidyl-prolyl isomerase